MSKKKKIVDSGRHFLEKLTEKYPEAQRAMIYEAINGVDTPDFFGGK